MNYAGMQLGDYLRQLRRSHRFTLAQLSATAGVSLNTLSRWETGAFQPRLAELEAALRALGVTSSQWEWALSLVEAPRAVARLRAKAQEQRSDLVELAGHAPSRGDLLRTLRFRRRMTVEQVATGLGVAPRSVRRWEEAEAALPEDRLDDLCRLLRVTPEERLALSQRRLGLWTPGREGPLSLEAAEQQCTHLVAKMDHGETALMDLHLLCLEAQLWPQAARSAGAQRVLALAFTTHAQYLEISGRGGEVQAYSDRALDLLVGKFAPEPWWFNAIHATGFVMLPHQAALQAALRNRRRVEYLRSWLDFSTDPFCQTGLYRDMAQYALEAGDIETALGWIGKAETLAERFGDPIPLHLAKHIHARALLAAGRAKEALPLLPSPEADIGPQQRLFDAYLWVEALQALDDRFGARDWLNRAYALCQEHGFTTEGTDALARRF
jgi:transcriptional regulator with XRE-family HTH domain